MDKKNAMVFVDNEKLAADIQKRLERVGVFLDTNVIRTIMEYQTNNYENLGIIKIVYRNP